MIYITVLKRIHHLGFWCSLLDSNCKSCFFFVRGLETFILLLPFSICFCWVTWLPEAYSMFCRGVELGSAVSRVFWTAQIGDELILFFLPGWQWVVLLAVFCLFLCFVCFFICFCLCACLFFVVSLFLSFFVYYQGDARITCPNISKMLWHNKMKPASGKSKL